MKTKLMYDKDDIIRTMRINNMTFTEKAIVESVLQWTMPREAIPIEWLMKWEKEHTREYETYFREAGKYAVECAIEDWRKESEDKE